MRTYAADEGMIMKKTIWLLLAICLMLLTACAESKPPETNSDVVTAQTAESLVPSPVVGTSEPAGMEAYKDPYWEVDSLEAFNELMSNADGYAYYYIFEKIPEDLKVVRVGISPDMDLYNITFLNPDNNRVQLFVFTMPEDYKYEYDGWESLSVDGVTYYYSQELESLEGEKYNDEQMVAYFEWEQDDKIILVHPKEPITEDVIRKYNELIKVEFNQGKQQVGLDTDQVLIADIDKIAALVRSNPEIHYHTGVVSGEYGDDLLR
jgi:hypothetical protein